MLPVFNDDLSHEGDIVDLTELHAEISRWFDEHPERQYHLVVPNEGYCEDTYFDVGGRGYEGYREMSESYGFVAFILYIRTAGTFRRVLQRSISVLPASQLHRSRSVLEAA
ncbi:MAG: hypothetical protein B7Y95_14825 [Rhizobiales bacterium 32-66-11]|nr:MAG: hypothetical protein B7Y95_14825 [Rhizobiales bacterium 32-66-11]